MNIHKKVIDRDLKELQKLKVRIGRHLLSLTPEERERENREVLEWAAAKLGKPLRIREAPPKRWRQQIP
jgi:hypothetical protein